MKTVKLPSGERVPAFGLGTWRMGEDRRRRAAEVEALRAGLDLGIRLIDTAEMYGEGEAEKLVAAAIDGRRDEVFLVSKVYPHNATRGGAIAACAGCGPIGSTSTCCTGAATFPWPRRWKHSPHSWRQERSATTA